MARTYTPDALAAAVAAIGIGACAQPETLDAVEPYGGAGGHDASADAGAAAVATGGSSGSSGGTGGSAATGGLAATGGTSGAAASGGVGAAGGASGGVGGTAGAGASADAAGGTAGLAGSGGTAPAGGSAGTAGVSGAAGTATGGSAGAGGTATGGTAGTSGTAGTAGAGGACSGTVEICNNVDDDGDGLIDEASSQNTSCSGSTLAQWNGAAYWFYTAGTMAYNDADAFCVTKGAHLASVMSQAENDFIHQGLGQVQHWIGFDDLVADGTWVWKDGSPATFTWFTCGAGDQSPSSCQEACCRVDASGCWGDEDCHSACFSLKNPKYPFPCKAPDACP